MIYRNKTTGAIVTQGDIRVQFPNTSFSAGEWDEDTLDFIGVDLVDCPEKPVDTEYQTVADDGIKLINNQWTQTWVMIDKYTSEELASYERHKAQHKWAFVRENRNKMLAEVDLRLIKHKELIDLEISPFDKDFPGVMSEALYRDTLFYKQELRNVPTNNTNPETINWPIDPIDKIGEYEYKWSLTVLEKYVLDRQLAQHDHRLDTVRAMRNALLLKMDTVETKHRNLKEMGISVSSEITPGVLPDELYMQVLLYKQALRDLPDTIVEGTLFRDIVWPINPIDNLRASKLTYSEA